MKRFLRAVCALFVRAEKLDGCELRHALVLCPADVRRYMRDELTMRGLARVYGSRVTAAEAEWN